MSWEELSDGVIGNTSHRRPKFSKQPKGTHKSHTVTDAERDEVMRFHRMFKSNNWIGARLGLTPTTVRSIIKEREKGNG